MLFSISKGEKLLFTMIDQVDFSAMSSLQRRPGGGSLLLYPISHFPPFNSQFNASFKVLDHCCISTS